jgi:hypothetical protein
MYRLYSSLASISLYGSGSMQEVFFLIGEGDVVLWSDASASPVYLPDSRARWEAIWTRREAIVEIAHSHPVGPLAFSREDETTMRALVQALGRPLLFSVVAPNGMVRRLEGGENEDRRSATIVDDGAEPWWTSLLRLASGMDKFSGSSTRPPKSSKTKARARRGPRKDVSKEK